ncbi:hypothetical protein [Chitinophaga flava]|uniref:Uncharacterized protein n=1 Tax=Chitinophaga flava TaxID=2259036 RepID=A0A365XT87_9BACT|nr:hypothetical protein [Chitinophaga flava]RBL89587.1 hypothetical protein DF182_24080 [Chitinophaga flava]
MSEDRVSFTILNQSEKDMYIIHEPEAFEFLLPPGEEVVVEMKPCKRGVALGQSIYNGHCVTAILDANSLYNVYYKGKDVFK